MRFHTFLYLHFLIYDMPIQIFCGFFYWVLHVFLTHLQELFMCSEYWCFVACNFNIIEFINISFIGLPWWRSG